ncbi:MAG: hypothetical protein JWQ08_1916 [Deinococcus sp.]|nr:hypothetical protein [Deinococcus sp.]
MGGMDYSSMGGTAQAASASLPGISVGGLDLSSLQNLSAKAVDRAFLSMMVPHHQAAVAMARAVLPLSQDDTVRTWANQIIQEQTLDLNALLNSSGGEDAALAAIATKSMAGMVRKATNPDVAFVQGRLPHHASAVEIAALALQK